MQNAIKLAILPLLTAGLGLTGEWMRPTTETVLEGTATHMDPGLIREVAFNRGMSLMGYIDAVALNRRGDIGKEVYLQRVLDGSVVGPLLVVDCVDFKDYARREGQGKVAETSAMLARLWDFYYVGPEPVRVFFHPQNWGVPMIN